jgi:phosphatidylglycerophosphate synthase
MTITGVAPWMVVLILSRELLVTTFRGMSESTGKDFGAKFSGKLKMTLQSITILVVLVFVNFRGWFQKHDWEDIAAVVRDVFIYATIVVTVYSGLIYVKRAADMFAKPADGDKV